MEGSIQAPFHHSFVAIGPAVSEEKIKMLKYDRRTDRRTDDDLWSGELKKKKTKKVCNYQRKQALTIEDK